MHKKKRGLNPLKMAGTTRLVLDLLHAHRVSPKKALLLPAQSVRYPDLFTTFTPSVRKSAELANTLLATINSAIKKKPHKVASFNGGNDEAVLTCSR